MVFFLLHLELAQMLREFLELLMANPSIAILIELRHQLPHIRFRWWWAVHQGKQLTQRKIQLLMA